MKKILFSILAIAALISCGKDDNNSDAPAYSAEEAKNFCPKCGKKSLCWEQGKRWSCPECDFVLYHNCAAAVAVVVICGDEILLTKRNQEPAKGKLDLAGGFTDPRESAEFTCFRELKEELDIEIDTEKFRFLMSLPNIYHYKGIDYNTLDLLEAHDYVLFSRL